MHLAEILVLWQREKYHKESKGYGRPIVAIFNNLIYIQFSIYIYVYIFLFIQFSIYIYGIFFLLIQFNIYIFKFSFIYLFNLIFLFMEYF